MSKSHGEKTHVLSYTLKFNPSKKKLIKLSFQRSPCSQSWTRFNSVWFPSPYSPPDSPFPLQTIFHQSTSSRKGLLHGRSPFNEACLPSKLVFYKGHLPLWVSPIKGHLPSTQICVVYTKFQTRSANYSKIIQVGVLVSYQLIVVVTYYIEK